MSNSLNRLDQVQDEPAAEQVQEQEQEVVVEEVVAEAVPEAVPPQGGEVEEVTTPAFEPAEAKGPEVAQRHAQPVADRERCERLRLQVLKSISDPELHKFVSEMSDGDTTWLFYALITSAAKTREGEAINHVRDLINNQVLAAPKPVVNVAVDVKGEVMPLVAPIEKKLAHVDEVLRELSDSEGGHADANLRALKKIKDEFQELKDEVVENLNKMGSKQQKFVNEVNNVTTTVAGLTKTVNSLAANPQKPNYMLIGIGLVCAMAFGLMTGITASRGLSDSDIRHIINQAATEAAAQTGAQPNTPRR